MAANHSRAYDMSFEPIQLKALVLDCDIRQSVLAASVAELVGRPISRPSINLCLNRGYIPETVVGFAKAVETVIGANERAMSWLVKRNMALAEIWNPLGRELRKVQPAGHAVRSVNKSRRAIVPAEECIELREVEMITQEARKHFKLFRDPFPANGGVEKESDIYMSEEHRFLEAIMLDAAKHSGLIAIVGQVGSGKSIIRKRVFESLRKEGGIKIVFPEILDKDRITSGTLCDAIVMDVSDERPKVRHEQKARQVKQLLKDRSRNGDRCCLVIEEAHNLTVQAFKTLKQLWELEDGYNKLISIILIGQTELGDKLDESQHPEMREFIRRCQIARIQGLNGNLKEYLQHKFKRIGITDVGSIIDDDAIKALSERLSTKDGHGKKLSHAYPLTVNLYVVRALNLAYEMGESKVTAEVVEAI